MLGKLSFPITRHTQPEKRKDTDAASIARYDCRTPFGTLGSFAGRPQTHDFGSGGTRKTHRENRTCDGTSSESGGTGAAAGAAPRSGVGPAGPHRRLGHHVGAATPSFSASWTRSLYPVP